MIRKLRLKFIAVNMGLVTIMLGAILGLVYGLTQIQLENRSTRMLQEITALSYSPNLAELAQRQGNPSYLVFQPDPAGEWDMMQSHNFELPQGVSCEDLVQQVIAAKKRTGNIKEYGLRYCFTEFPGGQRLVFADVSGNMEVLNNLMNNCLILGAAGFAVFLCVSIWLSRWAVRPVDEAMKQQRQFIADASHELKTPLTVIVTNAQLLQDPECSEATRQKCEKGIVAMSERMRSMTSQLLQLAKLDAAQPEKHREKLDLGSLLEDEILPYEPCFFEKGLLLHINIQPELWVNGDPEQLRQLLGILLDNARKYTAPGGSIRLMLKKKKRGRCILSVANEGELLSEEQCAKIFSRFYRTDGARSGESFGLGLAIAKSITEHHGGKIWMESSGGSNTCFVEMPCY